MGNTTFEITREEIEGLRYLKSAKRAASHLGIPQVLVDDVWAEMPAPRKRSEYESISASSGGSALSEAAEKARNGSEKLLESYSKFYRKWEVENGFRMGAGEQLLHAGFNG